MNLVEALGEALPDLPAQTAPRTYPKLDPRVIAREHIEQGAPTILAKMPGSDNFVRLSPEQWTLLQLFDGRRDYAEVSEVFLAETGIPFAQEDVREFATFMREQTDLFYKSPLEKNITLKQKSHSHREKRRRFRIGDVTDITLHRWPHADDYLTRLHPYVRFFYTRWCTALTLCAFATMIWMWMDKFDEIWVDSFQFYNFTAKSFTDLVEFWLLFGAMAFFHESAHGMSCKHFGGAVEKMEFILMYFAPTFVCDVTQVWIYGDRFARLVTIISGIWFDLILCVFATAIWWATPTGMAVHDFAYKVMMVSGIGVTLLNLNPLIKLDGYYMFAEITGEVDLKERATAYLSSWVRRTIFRLPVEIEYVTRKRRPFYIAYAILSGIYGYLLITIVVVFVYHVLRSVSPDWAFLPAGIVGVLIFKSRLRRLGRFMKTVYLDKKERLSAWLTPRRMAVLGAAVLLLLAVPIWPDFVQGKFVLEAARRSVIRAEVPGTVQQVLTDEGAVVAAGAPVVRLRNLTLESEAARAASDLQVATGRATQAQLRYAAFGPAEREREQLAQRNRVLSEQVAKLQVNSPIAGIVQTPRLHDLSGSYVTAGSVIAEVADPATMLARVYVPEFQMRDVRLGARVVLLPESRFEPLSGTLRAVAEVASAVPAGLVESSQLRGIRPPIFYMATVALADSRGLKEDMSGTAKIFVRRRNLLSFAWRSARDLVERRVW